MDLFTIVARIVHIFSGVFWVGGAILFFVFVEPAARATMPLSQKFMQTLLVRRHFNHYMTAVSALTVFGGAVLYWRDSGGLSLAWITTPTGLGFTIGAVVAITTFLMGLFVIKPRAERLGAVSMQIEAQGTPPTPEQLAEIGALNAALTKIGRADFFMLTIALLCMATARYW